MQEYKNYLAQERYSNSSIKTYTFLIEKFLEWTDIQGLLINTFDYKQAMKYVHFLKSKHSKPKTINQNLTAVQHYFEYQISIGNQINNPFLEVRIKGEQKNKLLHNLLSSDELEDLYYSYDTQTDKHPRRILCNKKNKVILGLLVYQGLTTSDLKRLELEHLEIAKGKIYIPRGNIGNRRTLMLKPWQVMEFMEYLNEVRLKLLPKNNLEMTNVFYASNNRLTDTVATILRKAKTTNHKVVNIHQIRASVIVNWLSKYNLREVQILAGHKYISTTERYVQEDLQQLQEMVSTFHPLQ